MEKKCFKCGEVKGLSSFYKHPRMADGRVNKCKECNKVDVQENRRKKVNFYREYDKSRGNRQGSEYCQEYRKKFPKKYRAHSMVLYAVRSGKLVPESCEVCGRDYGTHAHHDDYSKPLNIRWLCPPCHTAWHRKNGEAKNAR